MKILISILFLILALADQNTNLTGSYIFQIDLIEIPDKDVKIVYKRDYDYIEFTKRTYKKVLRNDCIIIGNIVKKQNTYQLRDSIIFFTKEISRQRVYSNYIEFKETKNDTINFEFKNFKNDKLISTGRFIKMKQ